jgi:hypothetical protein
MKGFLIQVTGDRIEELYWTPVEIEEEIFGIAYLNFATEDSEEENDFEEWWNSKNVIQIERVFVTEILI